MWAEKSPRLPQSVPRSANNRQKIGKERQVLVLYLERPVRQQCAAARSYTGRF
jgi:hypothetical protein